MLRAVRSMLAPLTLVLGLGLGLGVGACGSSASEGSARIDQAPVVTNDFIPQDQNLTDCVGTVQLPNCGSDTNKGDSHMYLAFGVMIAGLAFIGWRITVGLRNRERTTPPPADSTF